MSKGYFRKLATVGAAGALALQLFAGTASAAVPNASSDGFSYGSYAGDGYAGFSMSFDYKDTSTLAKLFLEIDISGASAVKQLVVEKNGSAVRGCDDSATMVRCDFKTVRTGEAISVLLVVQPSAGADEVRLEGGWSSTGYVEGGNNSHGDAWGLCQEGSAGCEVDEESETLHDLVSTRTNDDNVAAGFGNTSLNTSTVDLGGNGQAASLKGLPNGKYAYVNDNAGDGGNFPLVALEVNGGEPAAFQLLIVYPKGSGVPKSFEHISDGYGTTTYSSCSKGDKSPSECFVWNNKNNTVTIYLEHNGTLRRSG